MFGSLKRASDERLLKGFSRGRVQCFEELVARYHDMVESFARRLLQNAELAEEVTADTFERVARDRGQVTIQTSFRSYLFTIARNRCLDLLRRKRTEKRAEGVVLELERYRPPVAQPEAIALLGELANTLEHAVARLPETHREVLLLRLVHGLSSREVGEILDCSEEQIRSQLCYARKFIRKFMTGLDEEPNGHQQNQDKRSVRANETG